MAQKYSTRCHISDAEGNVCGQEIVLTAGIKVPEIGQEPEVKTKAFVQAIVGHLMKKHPGHAAFAMATMEQFLAYSVVGMTQSEDPGCMLFMARFAEYACKISALPVSDNMIVGLVTRMELTTEDPQRAKIIQAMQYIRDFQVRRLAPPVVDSSQIRLGPTA
jgi:hypothetical protein